VWKIRHFLHFGDAGSPHKKNTVQRGALLNDLDSGGSKEAIRVFDVIDWIIENYIWAINLVKPLFI
jgi:hypothetical protein